MGSIKQTHTPWQLLTPNKDALVKEFVGRSLNELRTPALVVDRAAFRDNCTKMHQNAKDWGASFRAHLKTHKVKYTWSLGDATSRPERKISCRRIKTAAYFGCWQDERCHCLDFNGSLGGCERGIGC